MVSRTICGAGCGDSTIASIVCGTMQETCGHTITPRIDAKAAPRTKRRKNGLLKIMHKCANLDLRDIPVTARPALRREEASLRASPPPSAPDGGRWSGG